MNRAANRAFKTLKKKNHSVYVRRRDKTLASKIHSKPFCCAGNKTKYIMSRFTESVQSMSLLQNFIKTNS